VASLGRKLTVSALSLAGALLLVEVGFRVGGYDPFGELFEGGRAEPGELMERGFLLESDDDVLVYELTPGARARAWGADVVVNSHGFRDDEVTLAKPPGTRRVVALGDSATFGVKLPVDVLWPRRLEEDLAGSAPPVEVLNLGIVGYDLLEEVAFLERRGIAFDPDVVVVAYHLNDVGNASPTRDYVQRLQTYGSPIYRIRLLQFLRGRLDRIQLSRAERTRNTEAVFLAENRDRIASLEGDDELAELRAVFAARLDAADLSTGRHRYAAWYASPARLGKLRFALERLHGLADRHGFRVLVVVVPWLGDAGFEELYDAAYAIVRHEVRRAGFDWLDVVPAFRAAGMEELRIEPSDLGHPDAGGHRLLAEAVRNALLERGWLREGD
jgi:lysophospholipase L1-like esterase